MKKNFDEDYLETKAEFIHALANSVRLKILYLLENKEVCVGDLANAMNVKQPNISQHLNILRNAKIIKKTKSGKTTCYHVIQPKVFEILNTVDSILKKQA